MSTPKDEVRKLLDRLPDEASLEEIQLYVIGLFMVRGILMYYGSVKGRPSQNWNPAFGEQLFLTWLLFLLISSGPKLNGHSRTSMNTRE